ncbi:MAG: flagellar biosynthesis protein FliQ [Lachnospiraceae bacterium]|nr:flagellar biosynthesis protein FliQ [Lachnospiraceae bacterium]
MSTELVTEIANKALYLVMKTALPILLVSLIVGLLVSIFQTVTSIQEQTLTFIPKIIAVFLALMLFGGWMLNNIVEYMTELWLNLPAYIKG